MRKYLYDVDYIESLVRPDSILHTEIPDTSR